MLGKLAVSALCFGDRDSNIIYRVSLIFDFQACQLNVPNDLCLLAVARSKEDTIIDRDNEYDVIAVENALIN